MAETKREIERKYEATGETPVPDLTRVRGVSEVLDRGVMELDAVYYDTPGLRLAADALTLRRRTGGDDAGWHLKFPVASGIRDEIRAPLADTLPGELAGLLRSRVRDAEVVPVVRLRSARDVRHLVDADGTLLAELSVDTVHAERLPGGAVATWTEIEVELADDTDPAFLDAVEKRLGKAGIRPAASASKLARALAETGGGPRAAATPGKPGTAGAAVLAYVREQIDAIVAYDPAVRRDLPDAVHQLRVACRRLRSAFRTYRRVLDRERTDPLGEELKWLAAELGVARDQEVLDERLRAHVKALPRTLVLGPVKARLRRRDAARGADARQRALAALDSDRHLALLEGLDALLADPPLRKAAGRDARKVLARAVRRDHDRLAGRIGHALALDPGHERDLALHEARKAAKRARYAADAARPTLKKPAKRLAKRVKAVQSLLGEHQDAVVARTALREVAAQAHGAGETAFTWGLLYGREEAAAEAAERELPRVWARASAPELKAALSR
ncbi:MULTISPECIES: CYTH and CHAD domain-containing protein [unclassified Streptomyces]|uniref:CYTH and CHAD domain-containing protein n=1 Tax=unclassified Streptomyces TaxID=2593676 RepID=UPI0006F9514C|nr:MULTISPECIES: CYTH and CHAD domain-containing protein [unclassified Streptomyces]KQX52946.1 metal-binding protein [Streptomyces sp. Root1304]KRA89863.1 metal-binding protein [Streptomyces sp. Root66D1]